MRCNDIIGDIEFYGADEDTFLEDGRYQRSCAFSLFQIGENVKNLSQELIKKNPDTDWRGISGLRDVIVHGCEYIRLDSLWKTISEEVPALRSKCEQILADTGRG